MIVASGTNRQATVRHLCKQFDRVLNVGGIVANLTWDEFNRNRLRRRLGRSPEVFIPSEFWIGDESDAGEARCDLLEHR